MIENTNGELRPDAELADNWYMNPANAKASLRSVSVRNSDEQFVPVIEKVAEDLSFPC